MSIPPIPRNKRELRRQLRAVCAAARGDSAPLRRALADWLAGHPEAAVIAAFHPLPDEPDLMPVIVSQPGRTWVFPVVRDGALEFRQVRDPETDLVAGTYGVREPAATCEPVAISRIDAFLCPGLAFDRAGGRLGRGMGYYDRALAGARADSPKLGICFPHQLVADTFGESHDVAMDALLCAMAEIPAVTANPAPPSGIPECG